MSISTTALKCCVSERTVQRELVKFARAGLLAVSPRYTPSGRQTSNIYRLNIEAVAHPDKLSPSTICSTTEGDNLSGSRVTADVGDGGDIAESHLEPPKNESINEPQLPSRVATRIEKLHAPAGLSITERDTIIAMLAGRSIADAQSLLDELAEALDSNVITTSATRWFRGLLRHYDQGKFVPIGALRVAERRRQHQAASIARKANSIPPTKPERAREHMAQISALLATKVQK